MRIQHGLEGQGNYYVHIGMLKKEYVIQADSLHGR
jgi:hypothetical protein